MKLANKLTQVMSYINKRDNTLREPRRQPVKLIEGIKAYVESITYLKSFQPIDPLVLDETISKIAQEYSIDISKNLQESVSNKNNTISLSFTSSLIQSRNSAKYSLSSSNNKGIEFMLSKSKYKIAYRGENQIKIFIKFGIGIGI